MPASEPHPAVQKRHVGIFISYRRSDNPDATGRIYDRLVSEFGKARVFKDVDSIPLGQDFRGHLNDVVGGCAAVLAIIGPKWTDIRNEAGQKRLDDPDDFVRIELEAALARNVPVVPVLVGHAPMPGASQLPASLGSLAFRQSIEVRPDPDFHNDATRLVSALKAIIDPNAAPVAPVAAKPTRAWSPWLAAFAAAATLAAVAFAIPAVRHLGEVPPPEIRTDIVTPATDQPSDFALSPDGKQIVFVAKEGGASRLWLRTFATAAVQSMPGTEGAVAPFWSPDSRSIGFFADGALKRLDMGAGPPQVVAQVRPGGTLGGTWSAGVILFGSGANLPLQSVADTGGAVTEILRPNSGYAWISLPQFLPDGRHFLFASRAGPGRGIYLSALDARAPVQLTGDADFAPMAYLPSGWMLWSRAGALTAQRLDLKKSVLTGQALTIADSIGSVSVSTTGFVAYRRTGSTLPRQLAWVDRTGTAHTVGDPDISLTGPAVSRDGQRMAFGRVTQGKTDIWLHDGIRSSRLTFDGTENTFPVWSPDGTRIVFSSSRNGRFGLYQKPSNGAGADERLIDYALPAFPSSWSADGRFLLYFTVNPQTGGDLWVLPMTGDRKAFPFLKTSTYEVWGKFSPDGRWVAYQSDESGSNEIYVRSFTPAGETSARPDAVGGKWQVSTGGGTFPVWRPDGKEIFFLSPRGEMMAAPIAFTGSAAVPATPVTLFQAHVVGGGADNIQGRQYDVTADGRFLINTVPDTGATPPITLIQNWNPDAAK